MATEEVVDGGEDTATNMGAATDPLPVGKDQDLEASSIPSSAFFFCFCVVFLHFSSKIQEPQSPYFFRTFALRSFFSFALMKKNGRRKITHETAL